MTKSAFSKSKPAKMATIAPVHAEQSGRTRVAAPKPSEPSKAASTSKSAVPAKPKKPAAARPTAGSKTKLALVVEMLRAKRGASADEIAKATGWQRHTVRGAIAGAVKRKLGLKVVTEDRDGIRVYRVVGR
jgi:hypothetical protein